MENEILKPGSRLFTWGPQLAAFHHPFVHQIKLDVMAMAFSLSHGLIGDERTAFSFLLLLALLNQGEKLLTKQTPDPDALDALEWTMRDVSPHREVGVVHIFFL